MDVTFEVGERYRNRNGEYDVIELSGDQMVLEYVKTRERLPASREIQGRIWLNICREERVEEEKQAPKPAKKRKSVKKQA
jgi:Holliday junction resolvase-like predicted endonuclease